MSTNIFEKASRLKLRFNTDRGHLSVEQLWDLPLTALDVIAISLQDELQATSTRSFLATNKKTTEPVQLRFDIVKSILDKRVAEKKAKEDALVREQEIAKIEALLVRKENEKLETASEEDLRKQLAALKG